MISNTKNDVLKKLNLSLMDPDEVSRYVVTAVYQKFSPWGNIPEIVKISLNEFVLEDVRKGIENLSFDEMRSLVEDMISGDYRYLKAADKSNSAIASLAAELMDIRNGDLVADFGCGEGGFLAAASRWCRENHKEARFYGVEIDDLNCEIARMAMEILNIDSKIVRNDILNRTEESLKYDRAYLYPPFALKTTSGISYKSRRFPGVMLPKISPEWYFVDRLLEDMREDSRIVAVLPEKLMYYTWDRSYREALIKSGLIEAVIELPNNALNGISTKVMIMVLSEGNESVRFIDASRMIRKSSGKTVEPDIRSIMSEYRSYADKTEHGRKVWINEIINDYDCLLTPSSLITVRPDVENGIRLGDIAQLDTGVQYTLAKFEKTGRLALNHTQYRLLTSADISEEGRIDFDRLENYAVNVEDFAQKYSVRKGDLVITSKSTKVKIAVVNQEPEGKVIVTGGMLIVRPEPGYDSYFLKGYLDSAEGKKQLALIQKGSTILSISENDLKNIIIPRFPIERQTELGSKVENLLKDIAELEDKLEAAKRNYRAFVGIDDENSEE